MHAVSFRKMSPGGNTTILVLEPAPAAARRIAISNELMHELHLGAEQVGFVDLSGSVPYLEMMGGEFCGNAARSLAALLALEKSDCLKPESADSSLLCGTIDVSGAGARLGVRARLMEGACGAPIVDASVEMPVAGAPDCCQTLDEGMDVVHMEGITHVLLDSTKHPMPSDTKAAAASLRQELGLVDHDAVGCIWYHQRGEGFSIDPVVWVRATNSTHHETACGSGTIALGLRQALLFNTGFDASVLQPSGQAIRATVTLTEKGTVQEAWIGGLVRMIAKGETYLFDCPETE